MAKKTETGKRAPKAGRRTLVFLGPSLPLAEAKRILPRAEYLPPIRRGDLGRIGNPRRCVVGIVDGIFHHSLAVSVAEVRLFLENGGVAYGASSMGALRAVELEPLGMIGVGAIYRGYLTRKLNSDEDVALTLNPETGAALTVPTVQVRAVVSAAKARGKISETAARRALAVSRSIFYAERTPRFLSEKWKTALTEKEAKVLSLLLEDPELDPKRADALALLRRMAEDASRVP